MQVLRTSTPAFRVAGRRVASLAAQTRCSSTSNDAAATVDLAYDLHEPAKPISDAKSSPILFLHGLFGAKKNNRTISK
jgi:hypothetical protein